MTTIFQISEQIQRMLGQNIGASARVHINEIKLLVSQVSSQVLKIDHLKVNMPEGDTIPNNCVIYTFTNVAVTTNGGKSKSTLPYIPMSLPRNMGVFQIIPVTTVSSVDTIGWETPLIPIPASMYGIVKPLSVLGSNVGYEVFGSDVYYTADMTTKNISKVIMRLVGVAIDAIDDYTILPLSADAQAQVIETVFKLLAGEAPKDRIADSNN
jgi:hypothetical protein